MVDTTIFGEEHPIYPGHAATIACQIAAQFPSLAVAAQPTSFGWPAALASRFVDGAGSRVYQALALLQRMKHGQSLDEALRQADAQWRQLCAAEDRPDGDAGCAQARRFVAAIDLPRWVVGHALSCQEGSGQASS